MGENKRLAHYFEYETNWSELRQLPDEHLAVMSILQYAASETNALRKIYLCQDHEATGKKALDSAINIHRFMVLRIWSARLFEVIQFLEDGKRKNFSGDELLLELTQRSLEQLEQISVGDGYETARDIRNEATNHYSYTAAKKNLQHVTSSMDCNMYLADKNGNEFFPMGEAVMFHARLNRRWANNDTAGRNERFLNWLNWNLNANQWLSLTHAQFAKELVFSKFPRNGARKKTYWVSDRYSAERKDSFTPIYFQDETP
ncbi:hypothetical protein [Ruegeria atlantica]|uniref:Uncharacterized protein n=1 Tax=Ruegeria atlantica TaxID=81569 RepID=A0ABX1WFJ7_9RHOB|nr:hypothetical protein [Ruegeria atlantica]NOD32006.1 hypothetical protein [Ruegeria atlantica]